MTLDFMILGAQKAATSSLHQALRVRPGISMPVGESAFFEDPDFASRPWTRFREEAGNQAKLGIKRPDSLCRNDIRERICSTHPSARFIVVLREPVSRAVSAYFHLARHGHIRAEGLDKAIDRGLADHREGLRTPSSSLVEFGLYGSSLEVWMQRYPERNFLVLGQTEVANDLPGVLSRCSTLIGTPDIAADTRGAGRDENVGSYDPRTFRMHRWGQLARTRPLAGTDRRVPRDAPALRFAGHCLVVLAKGLSRTGLPPPDLSPRIREELVDLYAADLPRLQGLVPPDAVYWATSPGNEGP